MFPLVVGIWMRVGVDREGSFLGAGDGQGLHYGGDVEVGWKGLRLLVRWGLLDVFHLVDDC